MSTPTTPTAARPKTNTSAHWYSPTGEPMHQVLKADKKGYTNTTLAHARKMNLVPSVTTILRILHKDALVNWKIEQACLAVLTTPKKDGEQVDAFVQRVLHIEAQQDEEAKAAAEFGTKIHDALELYFTGQEVPADLRDWIMPAVEQINAYGKVGATELVLVGHGYAGRTDLMQDCEGCYRLWDYKSTKKLPDPLKAGAWPEHRLQLAAYAKALEAKLRKANPQGIAEKDIITGNIYISSVNKGEFVVCEHEDPWETTFEQGFRPLIEHWQWSTGYAPSQPEFAEAEPAEQAETAPATQTAPAVIPPATNGGQPSAVPALPGTIGGKKVQWSSGERTA